MVYGRLLFNNIKQYTPKWFKTIPYAQTTKPTFKRLPQRVGIFNGTHVAKTMWKGIRNTFGQFAWSWSLLIFGFGFAWYYSMYYPYIAIYKYNNSQRTYAAAYSKERTYKKRKEQEERLAEEAEASAAAEEEKEPETTNIEQHGESDESIQNAPSYSSNYSDSNSSSQISKKQKLQALVNRILLEQEKKKNQNKRKPKSDEQ